jgi:trigger factor
MKVEVTDVEACKRRVAVEAPIEVVTKEWERAYGRIQKQARLPGFRKGHVPRPLVKVHFADDVRREVAEHLIPEVYRQALTEARLDPVNEPDIQDLRLEEGSPLSFVALVEVKPAITLNDYVDMEIQHASTAVTGERVDEALEHMRERQAEFRAVDRAAAPGDLVIADYTLTVEGEEPSSQSGYAFILGDGSVMPEIDAAAAGMRAGEERAVGFRFPDDHRRESLRGKSGTASLKVVEVKEKVLPALDDDFAKSMGEFESVAALRAEVVKQLESRQEADDRHALEDKIVEALLGRHEFSVPDSLVMRQIALQVEHARDRMRRQGVDPDAIAWDYPKLVGELRPSAERAVRRALLVDAIAEREGLAPSEADVDAEVDKIAQATQRPAPAVRRMMEKSGDLEALRRGLRERMTMQFLIDRARITPAAA